jgi:hypothetical protein
MSQVKNALSRPELRVPEKFELPPGKLIPTGQKPFLILASPLGTGALELFTAANTLQKLEVPFVIGAPKRAIIPTTGAVFIVPDCELRQCPEPAGLIIPSLIDAGVRELDAYVSQTIQAGTPVLTIGEGARIVARIGALQQRSAVTHFTQNDSQQKEFAQVKWTKEFLALDSTHQITTSAGMSTSARAIEVWVQTLSKKSGKMAPDSSSLRIQRKLPEPVIHSTELLRTFLNAGFNWSRREVGIALSPGISDLTLGHWLEALPRTFSLRSSTTSAKPEVFKTQAGVTVYPSTTLERSPPPDLLVVDRTQVAPILNQWIDDFQTPTLPVVHEARAVQQQISDTFLSLHQGRMLGIVGRLLEWPESGILDTAAAPVQDTPLLWILARIFGLGLLGSLVYRGLSRLSRE